MGTGVVLVGLSELERSFGGAIVMSKVLAGIGSGFFDEGITAAKVQGRDGCFGRNFFSILHVVSPLAAQGFTGRCKE